MRVRTTGESGFTKIAFLGPAAVVDMGSNVIRLATAEFSDEETFIRLAADRHTVRLSQGVRITLAYGLGAKAPVASR